MEIVALSAFRILIAIALFFFVPGFILTVLLFPRKEDLKSLERALTAIITSILVSIADGVICLVTIGLNFTTLSLSMLALSAVFAALASMRRRAVPKPERLAMQATDNAVYLAIAATILCLALVGVAVLSSHPNEATYSELYVLDANRHTLDYPLNVSVGSNSTVILGITNHENGTDTYAGTVTLNNTTIYTFRSLVLHKGENLERPLVIPFTSPGERQKLQFMFTDSSMKSYELHIWVNVRDT